MAYVRRGNGASRGALPSTFVLGRESDGEARLFLRFSIPLVRETNVYEAYLVLARSSAVEPDPAALTLHVARIVEAWDPRSISWGMQPRVEETRLPSTTVTPNGRRLVRLDVKDLVLRWRQHDPQDQGMVVVASGTTSSGMAFAFAPSGEEEPPPRLELYIK
jgi:hypothetical protein